MVSCKSLIVQQRLKTFLFRFPRLAGNAETVVRRVRRKHLQGSHRAGQDVPEVDDDVLQVHPDIPQSLREAVPRRRLRLHEAHRAVRGDVIDRSGERAVEIYF